MVKTVTLPIRIEPACGQVAEYDIHPSNKEACAVLHDDEPGSNDANGFGEVSP